ncbi:MAG: Ger(x)C family spore germination protein [Anaerobacillus sp.]|uniref:Ger(x)C family spore germination protein n=1 Tax=Anaerobacillus sp. TaxID=1872506 RepID=UPI00391DCA14
MRKVILAVFILVFLTSCWDLVEIEQLGFVLAVALDPLSEEELDQYKKQFQKETGEAIDHLHKTTYQVVIPSTIVAEGGGLEPEPFFNIATIGRTNFKMNRHIASRRSRKLNYEHLKVIILNENLVKSGEIGKLIDFYIRDHEMRRNTVMLISKGCASDVIANKLPLELMPAISIDMIHENYGVHPGMPSPKPIGDLVTSVLNEKSYIVPRVTAKKGKDFVITGAGVFLGKTNELVGWLGEIDIIGYNLIHSESQNMVIEVSVDDQLFNYEIDNEDAVITYERKDGRDYFQLNIKTEGFFVESWLENVELGNEQTNKMLSEAIAKQIERVATDVILKMQREFHADIFNFHSYVKRKEYQYWKQIKDEWDGEGGFFSKSIIEVDAEIKIRHHMTQEEMT